MSDENPRNLLEMKDALVRLGRQMLSEGPRGIILFEKAVSEVRQEPLALTLVKDSPLPTDPPPEADMDDSDVFLEKCLP